MLIMQKKIEERLVQAFSPSHLLVVNESKNHAGHAGDDGSGESHFSLSIWSECFVDVGRIARQKMVYGALQNEMKIIHALSITFDSDC